MSHHIEDYFCVDFCGAKLASEEFPEAVGSDAVHPAVWEFFLARRISKIAALALAALSENTSSSLPLILLSSNQSFCSPQTLEGKKEGAGTSLLH